MRRLNCCESESGNNREIEREGQSMCQIVIKIPEAVLYDTHMSSDDAAAFARRTVAMGYYTQNNVSIGYCAEIAGMTEEDFIKFLGQNKISIFRFDDQKEFMEELSNA